MKVIENETELNNEWLAEVGGIVCKAVIFSFDYSGILPVREKLWVKSLCSTGDLVMISRSGERIKGRVDDVTTALRTGTARFSTGKIPI